MRRFVAAVVLASGLLVAPAAASGAGTPLVVDNISPPASRALAHSPREIYYTGDGSGFLAGRGGSARSPGRLRWISSTGSQATASGADWIDNCKPSCAGGTFRAYPATLRFSGPSVLGGRLVYTRMKVTFTGARPPYAAYRSGSWSAHLRYTAHPGSYFWNT